MRTTSLSTSQMSPQCMSLYTESTELGATPARKDCSTAEAFGNVEVNLEQNSAGVHTERKRQDGPLRASYVKGKQHTLIAASLASPPELQKNTRSAQVFSTSHFASSPWSTG